MENKNDENEIERRRKQNNASVIKSLVAGVVEDIKTLPSTNNSINNNNNNNNSTSGKTKNNKNKSRSTNKTNKLRKKRKRSNDSEEKNEDQNEQIHEIQKERYDRLLFTSHKQIYKHVKQVKTFLLQKEIRSNNSKEKETKVSSIKTLDLNVVTQQAIRQLGLYHCDPRYKMITVDENEEEEVNANENKNEEGREEDVDDENMEDEEVVDDDDKTTLPKKGDEQENKGDDDKNCQEEENKNSIVAPMTIETSEGEEDDDVATAPIAEGVTTEEHDDVADTANKESENKQSNNSKKKEYRKKNNHNHNNKIEDAPTAVPLPLTQDDPQKIIVDSILTHKRFSKVLEEWNEKVTEYRRWCMKLEQRHGRMNPFGEDAIVVSSKRSKKNKNKSKNKRNVNSERTDNDNGLTAIVSNEASLFCTLGGGGGGDNDGDDDDMMEEGSMAVSGKYDKYGPAGVDGFVPLKKKNRQGQRGRRAKALAIEAKKRGDHKSRSNYQQNQYTSTNWREPKVRTTNENDQDNGGGGGRKIGSKVGSRGRGKEEKRNTERNGGGHSGGGDGGSYQKQQQQQSSTNKNKNDVTDATNEQQHPSWAAKQAQSTGIVAFQGKKITF